jgi:signal transduction histidine kinase
VLKPLQTITTTVRQITATNPHRRLVLDGPDELRGLGKTFDDLLARLEAAFDAQRRFVANASHELRTPLTLMRTALDVATGKTTPPPPEVHALAAKVRRGLDQADRLLESFLALARAEHTSLGRDVTVDLD